MEYEYECDNCDELFILPSSVDHLVRCPGCLQWAGVLLGEVIDDEVLSES